MPHRESSWDGKKALYGNVGQQDRRQIIEQGCPNRTEFRHPCYRVSVNVKFYIYLMIGHGQTSQHDEIIRSTCDDAISFTNGLVQ